MKHKHSKMISEKVNNMDLVVCINNYGNWEFGDLSQLVDLDAFPAFLCLLKHKDVVLAKLNGGECQFCHDGNWIDASSEQFDVWDNCWWYMCDRFESRIKPKKEKRWIGYCKNTNQTFPHPHKSKEVSEDYAMRNYEYPIDQWQFIEIEVEVNE